jgi:hypothetical protein
VAGPGGLVTRQSPRIRSPVEIRYLRVSPEGGDGLYSVSWVQAKLPRAVFARRWLIAVVWGCWGLLALARSRPRLRPAADRALAGWARVDLLLAGVVVYLLLFRLPPVALASALVFAVLVGVIHVLRVGRAWVVVTTLSLLVGVFVFLPWALNRIIIRQIAQIHHLTVDHRMVPNAERRINSDGVRFASEAEDLTDDDFVVLFLGDSFTYGTLLEYEESYPYRFEALARERPGLGNVRAVNCGWLSSSPLLNLRLLRDVGHKYRPDLVVYSLDMTDFHDDLHYAHPELAAARHRSG